MRLTAKSRYAVTAMLDLAMSGGSVSLRQVSQRHGLPISFLEQLFHEMRKKGLVVSERGKAGGFSLVLPANQISLYDILQAIDSPVQTTGCSPDSLNSCTNHKGKCLSHNVWSNLSQHITDFLVGTTLADVIGNVQNESCALKKAVGS